ncbi:putative dehydrogenase [Desulfocapsa sulfexigens DSM 10523]|uniref:Putative dehydrogenase n=1 Tax=Desulfocapsa sulfexigens (strain DSM 10523 / SB164P1) TaxID=1167006 RepID=M1PRM5_DESSD|nr:Gfo/Idh/MocA family oxidoreductase [Desulfocapsa sulfexigens]AGF78986.1 putative dehydrogenase [Desulfocapsa sulfexigens DSM 10523]
MADKHILIIGTGSVGKRHAQNLHKLGCAISCVDPRHDRLIEATEQIGIKLNGSYSSLEDALKQSTYDGAVVASPPVYHVEQSIECLKNNIPVLLEKPVSPNLQEAELLKTAVMDSDAHLLLGYTWRWWPSLVRVKEMLEEKAVGKLLHVTFVMSAHLADWHPWERYQDFFMADLEQGGGALLDESHWIDQMIWMLGGIPQEVTGKVEKLSNLQINSDDNVDILAKYPNNIRVTLHLDLFGRPHEKSIKFVGEEGTIVWKVDGILVGKSMDDEWEKETFSCDRNDMFIAVAQEFLDIVNGDVSPSCTIYDGVQVLRIIEAVRQSSSTGATVKMRSM